MSRSLPVALLLAAFLLPCGCAGVMVISTHADKDLTLDNVIDIKAGMSEAAVIERLGRPLSFGVGKDGLEFLHYENARLTGKGGAIPTPLFGAGSTSFEARGWAADIFLQDGVVKNTAYTIFREEAPAR